MSTFQPSKSQHVDSAYGALALGNNGGIKFYMMGDLLYALNSGNKTATLLISGGKAVSQSVDYDAALAGVKATGNKEISAADAKARQKAAGKLTTSSGTRVPSGTYSDNDGYSYDVTSNSVTIYKKSGAKWKTVTSSDDSWTSIMSNLVADSKAGTLKAGKAVPSTSYVPSAAASTATDTSSAAGAGTDDKNKDAFYKQPWFPFAVGGGILFLGIVTWALWPEAPKKKLPVQVVMRKRAPEQVQDEQEEAA